MNQKGFANIILIVLVVVLAGALGYFIITKKSEPVSQQQTQNSQNQIPSQNLPSKTQAPSPTLPTTVKSENWKTYQNNKYGFEFGYPENWNLDVSSGGKDAQGNDTGINVVVKYVPKTGVTEAVLINVCDGCNPNPNLYPETFLGHKASAWKDSAGFSEVNIPYIRSHGRSLILTSTETMSISYSVSSKSKSDADKVFNEDKELLEKIISTFRFVR